MFGYFSLYIRRHTLRIKTRLLSDMKDAMRSGDSLKRKVTKMLLSEIQYAEDSMNTDLTEEMTFNMIHAYYDRLKKTLGMQQVIHEEVALKLAIVGEYLSLFKERDIVQAIPISLNNKQLNSF